MKWIRIWLILSLCLSASAWAQDQNAVLFTVDNRPVSADEFKYVYQKNNKEASGYQEEDIREYLDLYLQFKLKVREARAQGLDTTKSFRREFKQYRNQLAEPYLRDQEATEALVREAYERMTEEIRVSHILISVKPDAAPRDTLKAYQLADSLRQEALQGANFNDLAVNYSDDPSRKNNQGDLGYFTAFQMIYPFESAAYQLQVGEISRPVRTRYGYHIIKLTDRRANRGQVTVAHLMIRPQKTEAGTEVVQTEQTIDSLYQRIQQGESFEELVSQYSDDRASAQRGGRLRPFSATSNYIPEDMREAAYNLEMEGDISKPFQTSYGYHIIKLIDKEPVASFEKMKDELRPKVRQNARSQKSKAAAVAKFKRENDFTTRNGLEGFTQYADSSLLEGAYEAPESYRKGWFIFKRSNDQKMFSLEKTSYRFSDFAQYIEKNQKEDRFKSMDQALSNYYQEFVNQSVMDYEKTHLSEKHPEYRRLLREYEEGILLYDIMNAEVWNKAARDSAGQEAFYEKHPKMFRTAHQRLDVELYHCRDQQTLKAFREQLNRNLETPPRKLVESFNDQKGSATTVRFETDTIVMGESPYYQDTVPPQGVFHQPGRIEGQPVLVRVVQVLPKAVRPFSEVRGLVISAYQDHLEEVWLKSLQKKISG